MFMVFFEDFKNMVFFIVDLMAHLNKHHKLINNFQNGKEYLDNHRFCNICEENVGKYQSRKQT